MSLPKNEIFYRASAEAIEAYEDRHYLGRKHFARLLGYRGPNAHVQLSSALNTTSYNPANPKRLSVDQLGVMLDEVDEDIRRDMLEKIVNRWGYGLCANRAGADEADEVMGLVAVLLDLGGRHGGLEEAVRSAIEDGVIDDEEREAIRRTAYEVRKLTKMIEEMTGGAR